MKRSKTPAKLGPGAQQPSPDKENRSEIPLTEDELLFRTLKQFADALVATFPRMFEVVVHDLSQPREIHQTRRR